MKYQQTFRGLKTPMPEAACERYEFLPVCWNWYSGKGVSPLVAPTVIRDRFAK